MKYYNLPRITAPPVAGEKLAQAVTAFSPFLSTSFGPDTWRVRRPWDFLGWDLAKVMVFCLTGTGICLLFFPTCQVRVVRFYVSCLLLSSSSCSTATLDAQCSLSDLNHDHPRPVFPAGPQPRPSPPSVPCRTSTTSIHAQCSLPDLNREYPRQVFPAGPHVGRYGTKNVQKKVRKNVRQVCYILLANSRVCGRVTGAMPLLTLQVAKFEAISLNR